MMAPAPPPDGARVGDRSTPTAAQNQAIAHQARKRAVGRLEQRGYQIVRLDALG